MTFEITTKGARWALSACVALMFGVAAAQAAEKKDSGPTQAQIDCNNRAVNDYYDQLKECDKALSDLPADNAMCHSDARDDLNRRRAGCTAAAMGGGATVGSQAVGGAVIEPAQPSRPPSRGPMIFQPGGTIQLFQQR